MIYNHRLLLLLTYLLIIVSISYAQDAMNQKIHDWFLEERFLIADQNDDALLELKELERFPNEFAYYLVNRNYSLTDQNEDGHLSFNELSKRTRSEYMYRYSMERKQLRALAGKHPYLAQADAKYLKQYPALVAELFGNLLWMVEHSKIAEKLYKDKIWTAKYPMVLLVLHKNLRWMTANPAEAKSLYNNRHTTRQLPELLGWRADHKAFMRNHSISNSFYGSNFLPNGIRLNR